MQERQATFGAFAVDRIDKKPGKRLRLIGTANLSVANQRER